MTLEELETKLTKLAEHVAEHELAIQALRDEVSKLRALLTEYPRALGDERDG